MIIRPKNAAEFSFHSGALCIYKLHFPASAENKDRVKVTMKQNLRVEPTFIATPHYRSEKAQIANLEVDSEISIGYPQNVYLSLVSTGVGREQPSDFHMEVQYAKFDPDAIAEAENDVITIQSKTIKTEYVGKYPCKLLTFKNRKIAVRI